LSRLLVPRNWAKGQLRSCKRGYTSPMVKDDLHKAEAVAFRGVSRGPATYMMYLENTSWVCTFRLYLFEGIARTCSGLVCRHTHCRNHDRVAKSCRISSKRNLFRAGWAIGSRLRRSPKHDRWLVLQRSSKLIVRVIASVTIYLEMLCNPTVNASTMTYHQVSPLLLNHTNTYDVWITTSSSTRVYIHLPFQVPS
jgi:hypothetical protein